MPVILNNITPITARARLNDARTHLNKMTSEVESFGGDDVLSRLGKKGYTGSARRAAIMVELMEEQMRLAEKWAGHHTYPAEEHDKMSEIGSRLKGFDNGQG